MAISPKQRYFILILYFIIISSLFCLPGSALPKHTWFQKLWFDKWVHIGFFLALTYLTCWTVQVVTKNHLLIIFFAALLYGILVEVVQDQFIPYRSFDWGDWVADTVGSYIGLGLWSQRYIKK